MFQWQLECYEVVVSPSLGHLLRDEAADGKRQFPPHLGWQQWVSWPVIRLVLFSYAVMHIKKHAGLAGSSTFAFIHS